MLGGFLTSWLIGHTDRFVAACSERAVNKMESAEWSSDAGGYFRYEIGPTHREAPGDHLGPPVRGQPVIACSQLLSFRLTLTPLAATVGVPN